MKKDMVKGALSANDMNNVAGGFGAAIKKFAKGTFGSIKHKLGFGSHKKAKPTSMANPIAQPIGTAQPMETVQTESAQTIETTEALG